MIQHDEDCKVSAWWYILAILYIFTQGHTPRYNTQPDSLHASNESAHGGNCPPKSRRREYYRRTDSDPSFNAMVGGRGVAEGQTKIVTSRFLIKEVVTDAPE